MDPSPDAPLPLSSIVSLLCYLLHIVFLLAAAALQRAANSASILPATPDAVRLRQSVLKPLLRRARFAAVASAVALVASALGFALAVASLALQPAWLVPMLVGALVLAALPAALVPIIIERCPRFAARLAAAVLGRRCSPAGPVAATPAVDAVDAALPECAETPAPAESDERALVAGVLRFGQKTVADIMTPRLDVSLVHLADDWTAVCQSVVQSGFSRLPVADAAADKVRGVIYAKDLLSARAEGPGYNWHSLIRAPFFVPESKMIDDLMREFQQGRVHIAIVVDEYGSFSGVVTMEDILEEIFGEIDDEFDEQERLYVKLDDSHYVFEGKTPLADFFSLLGLDAADYAPAADEAETVAGFVLALLDEFPTPHQRVEAGRLAFEVLALEGRRISRVRVALQPQEQDDAAD